MRFVALLIPFLRALALLVGALVATMAGVITLLVRQVMIRGGRRLLGGRRA